MKTKEMKNPKSGELPFSLTMGLLSEAKWAVLISQQGVPGF
jgi:hypothetical protein